MSRLRDRALDAAMDGRVEQVLDKAPLVVRHLHDRAHEGSLPARRVRLNGTDEGIRARSIGYRL